MDIALLKEVKQGNLSRVEWLTRDPTRSTPSVLAEALHVATTFHRVDMVQFLLQKKNKKKQSHYSENWDENDVNFVDYDFFDDKFGDAMTCLHKACRSGDFDIVQLLLHEGGASVTARSKIQQWSALHFAALSNHVPILQELLFLHQQQQQQDDWYFPCNVQRETPLHVAVQQGSLEAATLLVRHYGHDPSQEQSIIDARTVQGKTALHLAMTESPIILPLIHLLLQRGADPLARDKAGQSPFQMAVDLGHVESCRCMLQYVAPSTHDSPQFQHNKLAALRMLVRRAVERGYVDIFDLLLSSLPSDHMRQGLVNSPLQEEDAFYDGRTLLHCAAGLGNLPLVQRLVQVYGAHLHVTDQMGHSPLRVAIRAQRLPIVQFLLRQGIPVPHRGLHDAVEARQPDMIRLLLQYCDPSIINMTTAMQETVLQVAVDLGRSSNALEILNLLLDHGADANISSKYTGRCPIHHAASSNVLRALVDHGGANVNVADFNGCTPLHLLSRGINTGVMADTFCLDADRLSMMAYLLERGADLEAVGGGGGGVNGADGMTPLHMAAMAGNESALLFLLQKGANVNAKCRKQKFTPLHWALYKGHEKCARLLLQRPELQVDMVDSRGRSCLHWASERGQFHLVNQILHLPTQNSIDKIVHQMDRDGNTPLVLAAAQNHPNVVELLVRRTFLM